MRTLSAGPLIIAALVVAHSSTPARAQVVRLERAEVRLEEPFSFVRGMRELRDGRLLVADYIEQRVALVDLTTGGTRDVLTEGAGPSSVRLPFGLTPHLGDSTLVIDYGNDRLIVLAPDGRAVRTQVVDRPGRLFVRSMDASGAFPYAIPAWSEGPNALPEDTVRIVRWRPGGEATTEVARIQGNRFRKDRSPSMQPRVPIVGFAAQDAWVVASSGEIVIVRHAPYHLEVIGVDGRVNTGPAQVVAARAVTAADRRRFITEFAAGSPVSGRGPNGGMGRGDVPAAAEITRLIGTTEWAAFHPPFEAGGVFAAPGRRIWVKRTTDPEARPLYDVFDLAGARVQQVELPAGRRVVLVGARGVYAIVETEDGIQYVERYRLP